MRGPILVLVASWLMSNVAFAAPPPPPPAGAIELYARVITTPKSTDLAAYLLNFTDDVRVWANDEQVAHDRAGLRSFLENSSLNHTVVNVAYGNPLIVAETVDTFNPENFRAGVVQDCCYWARVAIYHYRAADDLVDEVRYVQNRSPWSQRDRAR